MPSLSLLSEAIANWEVEAAYIPAECKNKILARSYWLKQLIEEDIPRKKSCIPRKRKKAH